MEECDKGECEYRYAETRLNGNTTYMTDRWYYCVFCLTKLEMKEVSKYERGV